MVVVVAVSMIRSTGSNFFFFNGAGVSWKVKLSQTVCLSTQEAEYIALWEATEEVLNIRMLLKNLGPQQTTPLQDYINLNYINRVLDYNTDYNTITTL